MASNSVINIANCLLQELEHIDGDTLSEAFVLSIREVFGESLLLSAVDLVQKNRVTKLTSPSGKVLYEVIGRNKLLTVFENSNFCFCRKFQTKAMEENSQLLCKHILAVRIGAALNKCKIRQVTDKQMTNILIEIMSPNEELNIICNV